MGDTRGSPLSVLTLCRSKLL